MSKKENFAMVNTYPRPLAQRRHVHIPSVALGVLLGICVLLCGSWIIRDHKARSVIDNAHYSCIYGSIDACSFRNEMDTWYDQDLKAEIVKRGELIQYGENMEFRDYMPEAIEGWKK